MLVLASILATACAGADVWAQSPGGTGDPPKASAAPTVESTFEARMHAAQSVKVLTDILGIEAGADWDEAEEKLEKLSDPADRPKEEAEEGEHEKGHKGLWKLKGTDYENVFVQSDDKDHVTMITGFLRTDKLMPFAKVGDVSKAPVANENQVVWDVLRPGKPHFRVRAKGAGSKAAIIQIFVIPHIDPMRK